METVPLTGSDKSDGPDGSRAQRYLGRAALLVGIAGFVAFWTWAFFFASKEAVNAIDDLGWAARAQGICEAANAERLELADYRKLEEAGPELIRERADIVDRATDIIERMLDDVVAVRPSDAKGQAIVPQWESEYRRYLQDRREFAAQLRATGENLPFYESTEANLPISERLATFAGDNRMPDCAPPTDLTR